MEKASSTSTPWKPISGSLSLADPNVAAACSGLSEAIPDVGGQGPLVHLQPFCGKEEARLVSGVRKGNGHLRKTKLRVRK